MFGIWPVLGVCVKADEIAKLIVLDTKRQAMIVVAIVEAHVERLLLADGSDSIFHWQESAICEFMGVRGICARMVEAKHAPTNLALNTVAADNSLRSCLCAIMKRQQVCIVCMLGVRLEPLPKVCLIRWK